MYVNPGKWNSLYCLKAQAGCGSWYKLSARLKFWYSFFSAGYVYDFLLYGKTGKVFLQCPCIISGTKLLAQIIKTYSRYLSFFVISNNWSVIKAGFICYY